MLAMTQMTKDKRRLAITCVFEGVMTAWSIRCGVAKGWPWSQLEERPGSEMYGLCVDWCVGVLAGTRNGAIWQIKWTGDQRSKFSWLSSSLFVGCSIHSPAVHGI